MQAYARAFHGDPNCLFKWQVIPSKQITPAEALACVVFLQQIVALHSNPVTPPDFVQGCGFVCKKRVP
jgi:hypothetical protein